jgi:hypothetical protein
MKLKEVELEDEKFVLMEFSNKVLICKPIKVPLWPSSNNWATVYLPFKEVLKSNNKYMPHQGAKEINRRLNVKR